MATSVHFDDNLREDPKDVESLLSAELMRMSIKYKNEIDEEIHGVRCLAPEETPQFLNMSLHQLAMMLNSLPDEISKAFRQSQEFPNTYVNTVDFRLRFLRCELFDAEKAALRIAYFLNLCLEYFGVYALQRAIRLSDFKKNELKSLRKGRAQFLPFRDRSGRRVAAVFPGKEMSSIPEKIKTKIMMYIGWTAGDDVDTQRRGIVVLAWFDKAFDMSDYPLSNKHKLKDLTTVRSCAVHMCSPDSPVFRFIRACATMRAGHNRMKMRIHIGNTVELIYRLQGYGIPTDVLPITYSGTIKVQVMRQWMRVRNFLEEPLYQSTEEFRSVVECPYTSDIVFRQGTSIMTHPGNNAFRALIASKYDEIQKTATNLNVNGDKSSQLATRILVREIMEELERSNMRVLNWDDKQGFWRVLHDKSHIHVKIEYLVREHKNSIKAMINRQCNDSSTSAFYSSSTSQSCESCFCLENRSASG